MQHSSRHFSTFLHCARIVNSNKLGVLMGLALVVLGIVILLAAEIVGAYVDRACVSRATFEAIKSLAAQVVPFLPHSSEGSQLLFGGDEFYTHELLEWPGLERATVARFENHRLDLEWFPRGRMNGVGVGFSYFMPPLGLHALAAVCALVLCGSREWIARRKHQSPSFALACMVGVVLILFTLPAAFAAWSGPQLVSVFWEQVFDASGHGFVAAKDRVWVQPALCETSGLLVFGIMYAACLFAGAWWAAKFLLGVKGLAHSHRRIMRCDGVAHCGRCGHQLDNLTTCPECGLDQSDLPPRGWPWNSRWFRTQWARRVALLLFVGTALTVSAALPLIVGVAQVLLKRM